MYHVFIKSIETDEIVRKITKEPVDKAKADSIERGALINLNHNEYYIDIKETKEKEDE